MPLLPLRFRSLLPILLALGGLLIGIIGELTKLTQYSGLQDVLVFTVLIAVLLVKPTGLLGKQSIEKV